MDSYPLYHQGSPHNGFHQMRTKQGTSPFTQGFPITHTHTHTYMYTHMELLPKSVLQSPSFKKCPVPLKPHRSTHDKCEDSIRRMGGRALSPKKQWRCHHFFSVGFQHLRTNKICSFMLNCFSRSGSPKANRSTIVPTTPSIQVL